ncbi:MAG: AbrB family transcriptional regulator [Thaumarchaeota archaeon]|nr:AbrB family transcriptional regulator [Nitrososphaerota archaeon]
MSLQTTVSMAKPDSRSVRATVPEGIAVFLEIKAGDKLEWKMEIVNGERVAVVRKVK